MNNVLGLNSVLAAVPRMVSGKNHHDAILAVRYPVLMIHQWLRTGSLVEYVVVRTVV